MSLEDSLCQAQERAAAPSPEPDEHNVTETAAKPSEAEQQPASPKGDANFMGSVMRAVINENMSRRARTAKRKLAERRDAALKRTAKWQSQATQTEDAPPAWRRRQSRNQSIASDASGISLFPSESTLDAVSANVESIGVPLSAFARTQNVLDDTSTVLHFSAARFESLLKGFQRGLLQNFNGKGSTDELCETSNRQLIAFRTKGMKIFNIMKTLMDHVLHGVARPPPRAVRRRSRSKSGRASVSFEDGPSEEPDIKSSPLFDLNSPYKDSDNAGRSKPWMRRDSSEMVLAVLRELILLVHRELLRLLQHCKLRTSALSFLKIGDQFSSNSRKCVANYDFELMLKTDLTTLREATAFYTKEEAGIRSKLKCDLKARLLGKMSTNRACQTGFIFDSPFLSPAAHLSKADFADVAVGTHGGDLNVTTLGSARLQHTCTTAFPQRKAVTNRDYTSHRGKEQQKLVRVQYLSSSVQVHTESHGVSTMSFEPRPPELPPV